MPREVYAPEDVVIMSQAVETVVRDERSDMLTSRKRREEIAARAFRVASVQDAFDLDELVFLLRAEMRSAG
jgi:hypothetical protein